MQWPFVHNGKLNVLILYLSTLIESIDAVQDIIGVSLSGQDVVGVSLSEKDIIGV